MRSLLFTEGRIVFYLTLAVMIVGVIIWTPLFLAAFSFFLFSYYFFRNPKRCCPSYDTSLILAPADGLIIDIVTDVREMPDYVMRISIFLSLWDVHVNWTPIAGHILSISYHPGTFTFAFLPKSSEKNERNDITLLSDNGKKILVRQIAGMLARRISCWVKEGEKVRAGQKIGMIRFGSRVDLFLPTKTLVRIKKGDHVLGGQTVIAQWVDQTESSLSKVKEG